MSETSDCASVRDLIPELAAGVAAGDDRASATVHLARCPNCRRELAATAALIDDLLLLTPQQEPPAGFETAVLAALRPTPVHRSPRRLVALAAAVLVVIALAAGVATAVTWSSTQDDRRLAAQYRQTLAVANGRYLTAGRVTTANQTEIGHVYGYQGNPSWIFLAISDAPTPGPYAVVLVGAGGEADIGSCTIADNRRGSCGFTIDTAIATITSIELRRPDQTTLTARLAR